jgi:hypothetical protein
MARKIRKSSPASIFNFNEAAILVIVCLQVDLDNQPKL